MDNCLLDEVIQQCLQTLLDGLLIVQGTTEQGTFKLLIRTHGRVQFGVDGRVSCAAGIEELLAAQSGQHRIRAGDDLVNQTVHQMQGILLSSIANRANA